MGYIVKRRYCLEASRCDHASGHVRARTRLRSMPCLAGLGWNEGQEEIGSPVGKGRKVFKACLDRGAIRLALPDRASPDKSREAGDKDPCLMSAGAFVVKAGSEHVNDI